MTGRLIIASNRIASPGEPAPAGSRSRSADALGRTRRRRLVRLVGRDRRARDPRRPALRRRQRRATPSPTSPRPSTRATTSATPTARSGRSSTTASTSRISTRPTSPPTSRSTAASPGSSRSSPAPTTPSGCTTTTSCSWARRLRASGWEGRMGFFLHIPFPAPEVFTALPQHQRLARGLCAFDLVGFQTDRDTANFRRYLVEIAGGVAARRRPGPGLRPTVPPRPSPIGIDPDDIAAPRRRRGGPRRRRAARPHHREPRAGHRRRPHGLFQGPAAAHGGLRPHARRPRGAARQRQLPADRPALARGRRRLPGAARGARPARRPDQRRLCRPRLDADPLPRPQLLPRHALAASTASPASGWSRRCTTA